MKAMYQISVKLILGCLLFHSSLSAQQLSGYLTVMPSLIVLQPQDEAWWQTLAHNRLNFGWQMSPHLRMDAGVRNRFIAGSEMLIDPEGISHDQGLLDLSWNWASGKNALFNSAFDRLNVTYEKDKWKLQLGRQRINWGQTFVWNANDIFNTYSFFDFDYPERPGCDAFRATFYGSATSQTELAVSYRNDKATAAMMHRWNHNMVDYQLIAGLHAESDIVIGGALTSDFRGLNYRTEMSYFHPVKNAADTSGIVAVSVGADYFFGNSLMLQTEILYNSTGKSGDFMDMMGAASLSAKRMSICEWNIFVNASYPITPRLNGSLSGMYFVDINLCYAGFTLDYSVIENLDFSVITQFFSTIGNSEIGKMQMLMGFARLKYSF